ncbi:MAG: acyl-CoA dehydrogenase family protein [Deltaproteobacteria bacterium]|nr:acyl-CoA dehydrogenase family protein [Deltaproteobacteria bacterium]MBW2284999.1 acyl-CoA dehydrogenase family protein [Deltaproteobacteria bacterium]
MEREWLFEEDHRMFREIFSKWVAKELAPHAEEWEEKGEFPLELYQRVGELGFFAGDFPEEYGGVGGDYRYQVVFSEELAKCRSGGTAAGLVLHCAVAMPYIRDFGNQEQKEKYLASGIAGESIGALAVTEPDAGSDVAGIRTRAVRDGDDFVINGSKTFITNGVRADWYIVACKTDLDQGSRGITHIIVDKGTPGFTVSRKLDKLGWRASDTAELAFEDMRVPAGNVLGVENRGFHQTMHGFQTERLNMAVGSTAAARHCFDITLQYCKERKAFGRPIGTFQVNKHKFADMLTWIEAARRLAYHTVWLWINGLDCGKEIAMCKVFCCETAVKVADMCIQLHGGYGYMMEYEVQRIWRDQRIQPIGGGTSEIQKEIIGKLLGL